MCGTFLVGLCLLAPVRARADACGQIVGEVWTLADSPVRVQCDLDIAELVVDAGVEIVVEGDYAIVVSGVLRVLGTRDADVVIIPSATNTTGWKGFYLEDVADGSEFRWTRIEGAHDSALYLVRSTPLIDHVSFVDNRGGYGGYGGAIRAELAVSNADLEVRHSRFEGNVASRAGGAVYLAGPAGEGEAALVVLESRFIQNTAGSSAARNNTAGGALCVTGSARVLRSTFIANEVRAYTIYARGGRYTRGGAIYAAAGHTEIEASVFLRNASRMWAHAYTPDASRGYGGAVYLGSGDLSLTNSLVAENVLTGGRHPDKRGGGIYVNGGSASLVNSTLARNSYAAVHHSGGAVNIESSIVFFNTGDPQLAGTPTVSYSNVQGGYPGSNIASNPVFDWRYAIVVPSLSIDAGNPDPSFNDLFPPGLGNSTNDQGYTGGPGATFAPFVSAGDDQTVPEGSVAQLDGSGSYDLDGGAFSYAWRQIAGPTVVLSDPLAAQPTFVAPDVAAETILAFQLVLNDSAFDTAPDTVEVIVSHVNGVPQADAGVDQAADERTTVILDGSHSTDPDGDALTYLWTQLGGPSVVLSDVTAAQPTFTAPDVESSTTLVFELTVSDGVDTSEGDRTEVEVAHVNLPPVADAGPSQEVAERHLVTLDGTGSHDPDEDPITYSWRQLSGPSIALSDNSASQPTFEAPEVVVPEIAEFELVVNDGLADSQPDTVEVTIVNENRPPVADANEDQVVVERSEVVLDASRSSDPDGDALSYLWQQSSGPSVALSDATSMRPRFIAPDVAADTGMHFELVVNDGTASSAPDVVAVLITDANRAPVAHAGEDQTVDEGDVVTVDGTASSDPDNETLIFTWWQVSGPSVDLVTAQRGYASFVAPEVPTDTILELELIVSDGTLDSEPDRVAITVRQVNQAPVANAGADQVARESTPVTLDGSASTDADGDVLAFEWTQTAGPSAGLGDPAAASVVFTAPAVPFTTELRFQLVVSDGTALSAPDEVRVVVANDPLTADVDGSSRVDGFDLARLGIAYGSHPGDARWDAGADLTGDGVVDDADLDVISLEFGLSHRGS